MKYIFKLPKAALIKEGLKPNQILVLHDIYVLAKDTGKAKVSYDYLAKSNGLNSRTIVRTVTSLVTEGFLYMTSGKYEEHKKQEANEYSLTPKTIAIYGSSTDKKSALNSKAVKPVHMSSTDKKSGPSTDKMSGKYPLKGVNKEIQEVKHLFRDVSFCEKTYLKYIELGYPKSSAIKYAINAKK